MKHFIPNLNSSITKTIHYFIFVSSVFTQGINAQTFSLGLKAEPFCLISSINSQTEVNLYSTSFYFLLGVQVSQKIKVELQPGIIYSEDRRYNAIPEIGIFGKYFLRPGKEYFLLGLISHSNWNGSSNSIHAAGKNLFLGSIGIGTKTSKITLLELSYQFPNGNNEYCLQREYTNGIQRYTSVDLVGLLKLGFGISFDL